jgi:hypothetical protein
MLKLSQFYLQLAFVALRALGKNVQNQAGTIDYLASEALLQITLLGRRKIMIKNYQRCASLFQ